MSASSIRKAVTAGLSNDQERMNPTLDGCETEAVLCEAEKGGVTNAEAKAVLDAFNQTAGPKPSSPNPSGCLYTGPIRTAESTAKFEQFFAAYNIPGGKNETTLKNQIERTLELVPRGEPLARAPKTTHLIPLLVADNRPVDGPRVEAFVNAAKGTFYVQYTPARMFIGGKPNDPRTYGPFAINAGQAILNKCEVAAREALQKHFPPKYTQYFEFSPGTFQTTALNEETYGFTFQAEEFGGGFAGPIKKGTREFAGRFNERTGEVTFTKPSNGAGEPTNDPFAPAAPSPIQR